MLGVYTSIIVLEDKVEQQTRFGLTPQEWAYRIRNLYIELLWWLRQLRIYLQSRRPGFDPWVGKIPQGREWLPTPVFLPEEFHGQRSVAGYSPWVHKELDLTEWLTVHSTKVCSRASHKETAAKGLIQHCGSMIYQESTLLPDMSLSKLGELAMGREARHAAVPGVAKSRTRLSDWTGLNVTRANSQ